MGSQNPADEGLLQTLKDNIRSHFDFEEQRFCSVPSFNCVDHSIKHLSSGWYWRTRRRPSAARRSTGQRTGSLSTSRTRIINTRRGLLDQILETISLDLILRLVPVLH